MAYESMIKFRLTLRFSVSSVVRISEYIPLCLGISIPYIVFNPTIAFLGLGVG